LAPRLITPTPISSERGRDDIGLVFIGFLECSTDKIGAEIDFRGTQNLVMTESDIRSNASESIRIRLGSDKSGDVSSYEISAIER